jgi:predicted nucleic acid-binding protein
LGVDRLNAFLDRHRRIALDTSVLIYQLEENAKYGGLTDKIFHWLEQSGNQAVTSTITMTELLVQPYRQLDKKRADEFSALLSTYPKLEWIPTHLEIAELAARIRAFHRLKTPDALLAATAEYSRATGLITNDEVFERVRSFDTLVLDRLV